MNKQELLEERERLKDALVEIEKELARHPDNIRDAFAHNPSWNLDEFEKLVERVEFEGKVYRLRQGGNWCSDILDYGLIGKEQELDRSIIEMLFDQEDPIRYLREERGITDDNQLVGYLLSLSLEY